LSTFSFINGSKGNEGTYVSARRLYLELRSLGHQVDWHQCLDTGSDYLHNPDDRAIRGVHLGNRTLSMGFNRFFVYPRRIASIAAAGDEIVFSDPTLLAGVNLNGRMTVILHDTRAMTKYRDKFSTYLMYLYLIPKLKNARRIIVPTEFVKEALLALGFDDSVISVLHLTSSLDDVKKLNLPRTHKTSTSERKLTIIYVASDRPYKNIDFFIRLASKFKDSGKGNQYNFVLVSMPTRRTLRLLKALNLKNLTLLTEVPNMQEVYGSVDVLAYPSLYEGFGLPLIEAMSMGLPVVANNIEPFREIVSTGGLLADVGDIDSWMSFITALSDDVFYSRMSSASLKRYEAFSPTEYRKNVMKIFNGVE
jgi:glycosyltransferase involved in cell wall biosynthesis